MSCRATRIGRRMCSHCVSIDRSQGYGGDILLPTRQNRRCKFTKLLQITLVKDKYLSRLCFYFY